MDNKLNSKLNYEQLLLILEKLILQNTIEEKKDFYQLLEEISTNYNHTSEELLMRGFRKAYRQIADGV